MSSVEISILYVFGLRLWNWVCSDGDDDFMLQYVE